MDPERPLLKLHPYHVYNSPGDILWIRFLVLNSFMTGEDRLA